MSELQSRLRQDLSAAMRSGEPQQVRVLRTLLSALANAEAQPDLDETPVSLRSDGVIVGASDGVAAAGADRRTLDARDERAIIESERDQRTAAADELDSRRAHDAAAVLRDEAALVQRYID